MPSLRCPFCAAQVPLTASRCPGCGLPLTGPIVYRIQAIDAEFAGLGQRWTALLAERAELVSGLVAERDRLASAPQPAAAGWPAATHQGGSPAVDQPGWAAGPGPGRVGADASAVSVQNLLLGLGALLLGVAAAVFTVVAWGRLGIAGKTGILLALTAAALAAPVPLVRRGLRSSAETVAALGLALAVLDTYAIWRLNLGGLNAVDGWTYAAAVTALLAVAWAGYPLLVPLRGPRPTALVLAQLPLPLAAVAAGPTPFGLALAVLGMAAFDAVIDAALRRRSAAGSRPDPVVERTVATLLGSAAWLVAALVAAVAGTFATGVPVRAATLLGLCAAVAIGYAATRPAGSARDVAASAGGLAAAAGALLSIREPLGRWDPLAPAALAVAALAIALLLAPAWRRGAQATGAVLVLIGGAMPAAGAAVAAAGPLGWLTVPWTGHSGPARQVLTPSPPPNEWLPPVAALPAAALVTLALVLGALGAVRARTGRAAAAGIAVVGATATVLLAPVTLDLPYPVALVVLAAAAIALAGLAAAVRHPTLAALAGTAALTLVAVGLAWSLATQSATITGLAVAAGVAAVVAAAGRLTRVRVAAIAVATAIAAADAAAIALAAGAPARWAAFAVLGVAAAATAMAAILAGTRQPAEPTGGWRAESWAVELTAAGLAVVGVAMAVPTGITASLAFAVLGGCLGAAALRPDRRWLAPAGGAALLIAGWIALGTAGVQAVEAYTLPPAAIALAAGLLRRRAGAAEASWPAYGPGLALGLVPSLTVAWTDPGWSRPLLLGLAALATTLVGARHRLQAPLVLGAAVVGLLALRELGPVVLQLAADLPRWVPLAIAGALLVALGATYERRLRELRRTRDAFSRLA